MGSIDIPEREWIAALRAGDERAFTALFRRYYEPLCRYAFRETRSQDTAEDVVQAVFAGVWHLGDRFEVRDSLRGYLYGAVRHQLSSRGRDSRVRARHQAELGRLAGAAAEVSAWQQANADLECAELREAIVRAIAALPPKGREAFELSRRDGLSYAEIAHVMGISRKTVEVHITRALTALRLSLSTYLGTLLALHSS